MSIVIYHNPRCSKSRSTLQLLADRGIHPVVVEYLKAPPTVEELKILLGKLGMTPRQLLRKSEAVYKELGLDDTRLPDDALIKAMAEHPVLIERPIVVSGDKAALGRPPEAVLALL